MSGSHSGGNGAGRYVEAPSNRAGHREAWDSVPSVEQLRPGDKEWLR